jgi:hypothetical protein
MPEFIQLDLDRTKLAASVYRGTSHRTSPWGLIVEQEVKRELEEFLKAFMSFVQCPLDSFLRLDAFPTPRGLTIIEINVELQDGWGVALNLLRAAALPLEIPAGIAMPERFVDYGDGHREELELACSELSLLAHSCSVVEQLLPEGMHPEKSEWDSKMYLARFRHFWAGQHVQVPMMYSVDFASWESIPPNVVLKFTHKYGPESASAGFSVLSREKAGKGRFLRRCYADGKLVAQEKATPALLEDGSVAQVVILCSGSYPITGYTQVAAPRTFVINDRTGAVGPLVFE